MADNVDITAVDPAIGVDATVAADDIGGIAYQRVKLTLGVDGADDGDVSATNPIPVTGSVTAVVTGALTDTELRATPVEVSVVVPIDKDGQPDLLVEDIFLREAVQISSLYVDDPDQTDIENSVLLMAMSMDKYNQMPMFVEVSNPIKTDAVGNQIPSDAPAPILWRSSVAASIKVIDTTGYQSAMIQQLSAGVVTPTTSNDGLTWVGTSIMISANPAALLAATTGAGLWIMPVTGRYIKLAGPASLVDCVIYLRQTPFSAYLAQLVPQQNIISVAGTAINATAAALGIIPIGGLIAAGTAPTASPVLIGGRDGRTTPLTRTFRTNDDGALVVTPVSYTMLVPPPFTSYENVQPQMTKNISLCEGWTIEDLLGRILIELKAQNIILHEMAIGAPIDSPDVIAHDLAAIN